MGISEILGAVFILAILVVGILQIAGFVDLRK